MPGSIPRNPPLPSLPPNGLPGGRGRGKPPPQKGWGLRQARPAQCGGVWGTRGVSPATRGGVPLPDAPHVAPRPWLRTSGSGRAPPDGVTAPRPARAQDAGTRGQPLPAAERASRAAFGELRLPCLHKFVQRTNEKFQRPLGRAAVGGDQGWARNALFLSSRKGRLSASCPSPSEDALSWPCCHRKPLWEHLRLGPRVDSRK